MRGSIEQTIMDDITVMRNIANELVSSEINLLKSEAQAAATRLKATPMDMWNSTIQDLVESNSVFKAITIFDRTGQLIAGYGHPQTPQELLFSETTKMVFSGESVISTTRIDPSGEVVFHICVPLAQLLLSVTISGLHFTELVEKHRIWETGTIFIFDSEGTIIANNRHYYVLNRYNFLTDPSQSKEILTSQAAVRRVLRNQEGTVRYPLEGIERVASFTRITGSNSGWVLGVAAPISESPAAKLDFGLFTMTFVFLLLGTVLAYFASGFVDRQFKTINEQYNNLTELSSIAQSASEAKTHFLANMSHEMRTPLNAVIGFSELILHGHSDPSEIEDELRNIHTAGQTLLGIVNDILDISKIESGKFELIPVDFDLASLINDTVTINLLRIGEKPIEFGLEIDKKLPSRMFGDELRLKQIFNNLLSNAFKYTMEGSVDLSVSGYRAEENVWLVITVTDSGIGIRAEDLTKLFSDYNQVDTKSNRKIEGTGLGLSITKKLVELMDGTIDVKSVYGQGSTFKVTVRQQFVTSVPIGEKVVENLESLDGAYKNQIQKDLVIAPMPYARVLVVDDVQANLDVARGMLKPYGMQIDCATRGQQAIDLIKEAKVKYNAIFMDHMMPEMDGIEAVAKIRELDSEYAKTIPIIALTANAIVGNEQLFLASGFQAFVSKPIELRRIDIVLKQWVRNKELEGQLHANSQHPAPASVPKASKIDPENEKRLLAEFENQAKEFELMFSAESKADQANGRSGPADVTAPVITKVPEPSPANSQLSGLTKVSPGPEALSRQKDDNIPAATAEEPKRYTCEGIDLIEGVKRFSGDRQVYYDVLKSYRDSIASLLDQVKTPNQENLKNYTIVLHGIKSSSYGVCAKEVGQLAEVLEQKSYSGDLDFVMANNSQFLQAVERMMTSLNQLFEEVGEKTKPLLDNPDPEILARLRTACQSYDMDGVDLAINELDGFSYSSDPNLTAWLKDRAEELDFQTILTRLPSA
jgi:signal transduction histidine kinase/CheY-like chemotaxis protein